MNVEELDGFFAALIAGPKTVMPSEYLPEVFGGEMSDTCEFSSIEDANEILGLLMRHWNTIAWTLLKGEVYVPLLLEDEAATTAHGNDWARGFMRGVNMRNDSWDGLIEDDAYERTPEFAAERTLFVAEIRRIFTAQEVSSYLDELERAKFLSPCEPDEEDSGLDEEDFEDGVLDNPVLGAEEILRFARIKEMFQAGY
jgi:uncharacterized protein YecA (UPF0149 family)